jgi:carbamoyl-phosphate synthase small subunit
MTSSPPTGVIVLGDGTVVWGQGFGAAKEAVGEICFNTAMTGYQEALSDPSFAGQIITFTFPHIGNVGTNIDDLECTNPSCRGLILREMPTAPSNYRSTDTLAHWCESFGLVGVANIDTRSLTKRIRDLGAPNGVIAYNPDGKFDIDALKQKAAEWPGLDGMDLALEVACTQRYEWNENVWGKDTPADIMARPHVVAVDYGVKRNILRCLVEAGFRVTVVPPQTDADTILSLNPAGIFLANGPGDPAATGVYAVPIIQDLLKSGKPIFGICLGHQMLALALGGKTRKMPLGHRGANHPVKELSTGRVYITSQNHGFEVLSDTLPANARVTHVSLFDGTNEGFEMTDRPVFSVQYHPEASPGPMENKVLFERFMALCATGAKAAA